VLAFALILLIAVTNFAIGFGLAVHLGHGPRWIRLPSPNAIRRWIQSVGKRTTAPASHAARH
jgi:hypothetical protein